MFVYNALGNMTETIYPDDTPGDPSDNPRSESHYDQTGRLKAEIDERGNRTEYAFDAVGRPTTVRNALGGTITKEYDEASRKTSVTDQLGRTTRYVYDESGRLVETLLCGRYISCQDLRCAWPSGERYRPGCGTTHFAYESHDQLLISTNRWGRNTERPSA